jgi:hypothetical protein
MSQDRPVTPEKQLLNLIEKPMAKSSLSAAAIKHRSMSVFSLDALKGRFAFFKNRFKTDLKSGALVQMDIRVVNRFLKICVAVLTFYFLLNLSFSLTHLRGDIKISPNLVGIKEMKPLEIGSLLKSASYYLEKARGRNIFMMSKSIVSSGPAPASSQKILEVAQNLKLVGISWSDDPDVMIEDTKIQRTFFLKKGQVIENDIRLKAVFKDKVILSYGTEEMELR